MTADVNAKDLAEEEAAMRKLAELAAQVADELARRRLRGELVGELREDEDIRSVRADQMLAESRRLRCGEDMTG